MVSVYCVLVIQFIVYRLFSLLCIGYSVYCVLVIQFIVYRLFSLLCIGYSSNHKTHVRISHGIVHILLCFFIIIICTLNAFNNTYMAPYS